MRQNVAALEMSLVVIVSSNPNAVFAGWKMRPGAGQSATPYRLLNT
jgi:hypothetical protein